MDNLWILPAAVTLVSFTWAWAPVWFTAGKGRRKAPRSWSNCAPLFRTLLAVVMVETTWIFYLGATAFHIESLCAHAHHLTD